MRDWLSRRREERARADEAMGRLLEEYTERLEAQDPDALESARDYYNHDNGFPWRAEVGLSLGILIFFGSLIPLIAFFMWIMHLTGG